MSKYKSLTTKYLAAQKLLEERDQTISRLHKKLAEMRSCIKTEPSDKWYMIYLMKTNSGLEKHIENQTEIINQYQEHYKKYGRFYTEWEKKCQEES